MGSWAGPPGSRGGVQGETSGTSIVFEGDPWGGGVKVQRRTHRVAGGGDCGKALFTRHNGRTPQHGAASETPMNVCSFNSTSVSGLFHHFESDVDVHLL